MSFLDRFKSFARRPEGFFLIASIVSGGIFLLIIPPLQTPDEASHFFRSYQVSQLGFVPIVRDGNVGGDLPTSFAETVKFLDTKPSLRFHPETKYDLHRTKAALNMPLQKNTTHFTSGVAGYSPVGYLPQAASLLIGTFFNLPVVALMYIARLASLTTWIVLVFFAIKIVPVKKWAFVGLGLLPMLVAQAISPGIDAISIGLSVLFIAIVLKLRTVPKISTKWLVSLIAIAALIALTKQTALLVLGFVFLLHSNQFDGAKWKAVLKKLLVIIVPVLLFISWTALASHLNVTSSSVPGQNSSAQLLDIIHNPFRFPQVLFNTFFTTWGDDVIRSFIGNFGWMDTPLAGGIVAIGYVFIAFMLFTNYEPITNKLLLTRSSRWLLGVLASLYVIGTCAALYLFYSPVDFNIIYGLQGRYFLLVLFMLVPLFASLSLRMPKRNFIKTIHVASTFLLLASALTIYLRFYIVLF
jgi:uncharacterized membrane protein